MNDEEKINGFDKFIAVIVGFSFFMTAYSLYKAFGGTNNPAQIGNAVALFFAILGAANFEGSFFYWGDKKSKADGVQFGVAKDAQRVAMYMSLASTLVGLLMLTEFGNGIRENLDAWILGAVFIAMIVFSLYTNVNSYTLYSDSDPSRIEEIENAEYESAMGRQRHKEKMMLVERSTRRLHRGVQEKTDELTGVLANKSLSRVQSEVHKIGGRGGEAPDRSQRPQLPGVTAPAPLQTKPTQQFAAEAKAVMDRVEKYDPTNDILDLSGEKSPNPQAANKGPHQNTQRPQRQ